MILTIISAITPNRAIGLRGQLLYHLSADLRRFKALTTGHTVVMGRKTFESLPKGALPNRRNIVLSRHLGAEAFPGTEVYTSLQEALKACSAEEQVFVIGGESVYAEALPLANRLCLTHVHAIPDEADAYFPEYKTEDWCKVFEEEHEADERNAVPYTFVDYERKRKL